MAFESTKEKTVKHDFLTFLLLRVIKVALKVVIKQNFIINFFNYNFSNS